MQFTPLPASVQTEQGICPRRVRTVEDYEYTERDPISGVEIVFKEVGIEALVYPFSGELTVHDVIETERQLVDGDWVVKTVRYSAVKTPTVRGLRQAILAKAHGDHEWQDRVLAEFGYQRVDEVA